MNENHHKCTRCGYSTNHLVTFKRHLSRKNICKNLLNNYSLHDLYIKYNITNKIDSVKNENKMKPNEAILKYGEAKCKPNEASESENFECKFCKKIYFHRQSLYKHLKKCEEKKKDDEDKKNLLNLVEILNKQLEEQRDQINEQNNQINELIKKTGINIGTQNIQQNINILAYNNTDISHLTDKDYLKCLKHSNFCIPHLIEQIHFNPKKPENHNIYISNLKNNYVMVYDGIRWIIRDRDESIQNLIDDKESIIEQKLEEWIENGNKYPDIMKKFNRYLEKKENDKVFNKVKGEIKLMLFNNRDIISLK